MKKITLIICANLMVAIGMAQVHVVNDAFIYAKGADIFINDGLELRDANSMLYLREGGATTGSIVGDGNGKMAQLLQKNPNAVNSGLGSLSVFQEGVADNFTYNYWSSPVSKPGLAASNTGFSYTQIYFPLLMERFEFETDFVINAEQAEFLSTNLKDGETDVQSFTTVDIDGNPATPVVTDKLKIAKRWLYSYKSADPNDQSAVTGGGYFGWKSFQNDEDIVKPGYGFTMKGVAAGSGPNIIPSAAGTGQRYDFRGIPNNGTYTVAVANGDFSLVGNPYPSALDLKLFMEDNAGLIDGQLYFWDSQSTGSHFLNEYEGGYGTFSPQVGDPNSNGVYVDAVFKMYDEQGNVIDDNVGGGGLSGPVGDVEFASRRYAAVGQGFLIQRSSDGDFTGTSGTVNFNNSQRVIVKENGDTSLFKNSSTATASVNKTPAMSIEVLINEQYSRNMIVTFLDNTTIGWDWGMDASNSGNKTGTDAFMTIGDKQALIQSLPFDELETVIPLNFKSAEENATFKIKISGRENFDPNFVLLHDKVNGAYYDILNETYALETGLGDTQDRFQIVFMDKSTLSNDTVEMDKSFTIFQNNDLSQITVLNPTNKNINDISVYNMAGALVGSIQPTQSDLKFTIPTNNFSVGIYIVKVSTLNNKVISRKVSISN